MTEERKEYMRAYSQRRKALGICKVCGYPAIAGKTLCDYCNARNNERRREKYRISHIAGYSI